MIVLPVIVVVAIGLAIYWLVRRPALAHPGGSTHTATRPVRPSTTLGWASVWTLLAAAIAQLVLSGVVIWGGAPLGAAGCVLAIVAMVRFHDHGLLLWLPVVIGAFLLAFPFVFWIGG